MGRKLGALFPLFGEGQLDPHLAQCRLRRGLPPYQHTKWHVNPTSHLATTDMGGKLGEAVPLREIGTRVPI